MQNVCLNLKSFHSIMNAFQFFLRFLFAPIILLNTLFGSTVGLLIFSKKKLDKMGPIQIYKCLLAIEYLDVLVLKQYLQYAFGIDFTTYSTVICRAYWYVSYVYASTLPYLLVYISTERYVAVTFPSKRFLLRKQLIQTVYFGVLITYEAVFYLPTLIYWNVSAKSLSMNQSLNETNATDMMVYSCGPVDSNAYNILSWIDMGNRVIVPFFLMIVCTLMLIGKIFHSRIKFNRRLTENKMFRKDIGFSTTSILINVIFLVLTLPVSVWVFVPEFSGAQHEDVWILVQYLIYTCYSSDFIIIFMTNSLFRSEFFSLFKK